MLENFDQDEYYDGFDLDEEETIDSSDEVESGWDEDWDDPDEFFDDVEDDSEDDDDADWDEYDDDDGFDD